MRKILAAILIVFGLYFIFTNVSFRPQEALNKSSYPTSAKAPPEEVLVTRVIDGDTFEIQGGRRVRYIGINAPETVDPDKPKECFGKEASDENRELVQGQEVRLLKDTSEVDKYGRLLRYVYKNGVFINEFLVKNGFARATPYSPDTKYEKLFLEGQNYAQENSLGLWKSC